MSAAPMFQSDKARQYDQRMQRAIPGYDTLHRLSGLMITAATGGTGRVLVVGAGTGSECIAMAQANPDLHITGVDPAADMIAHGQAKLTERHLTGRVTLHACLLDDFPDHPPFDAATLLLVLHFLPDDGAKLALLRSIANRLKPGAPLVLADVTGDGWDTPAQARLRHGWEWLQRQAGMSDQDIARGFRMVDRDMHPLTADRERALLEQAGFSPPEPFFRALCFTAVLSIKNA